MTRRAITEEQAKSPSAPLRPAPHVRRFLDAGDVRLSYLEYEPVAAGANRPVMLCVHGGAAHAHWFDFVAGELTREYRVLALDQRGHGESAWVQPPAYAYPDYAADLDRFAGALDLRDFVLVGHSMGGTVSLAYVATFPGRAAKLVVVDSTPQMTAERVAALRDVGTRSGSRYTTKEEFVARFRLRPAGTGAAPEVLRHLAHHSAREFPDGTWRHKFDRDVYATRETVDGLPNWNHVRIPALLVKAERSARITPQALAEVRARCPQVEFTEVPGCDHHVTLDNPAGFVQALRAFLARHP